MSNSDNNPTPSVVAASAMPPVVDRASFDAQVDQMRAREKAHTHEGDAIAAARRRLPMQCEGCTLFNSQIGELSYLHSRDITYAVLCQGSYPESARYREFMGWTMPWYSAQPSLDALFAGRQIGVFHLVSYLRDGDRVFETYWTHRRGVHAMDYNYALMDLTAYGRQEQWEDSPAGWPRRGHAMRTSGGAPDWTPLAEWPGGRPTAQWPRLAAGHSDDLGTTGP